MNADRRDEILKAYTCRAGRFDEIASRRARRTRMFLEVQSDVRSLRVTGSLPRCEPGSLSARQQDVLFLIAEGLANHEIGSKLGISIETVKTHVEHLLSRLAARNRAHVVHLACQHGLLNAGCTVSMTDVRRAVPASLSPL